MKRTSLFVDDSVMEALRELAEQDGRSVSATVRAALEEFVARRRPRRLPSFAGAGRSGRSDIAERAEELLWAAPPEPKS